MKVLVTRPEHQSEQLIRALESRGHQPQLLPLLEIEPLVCSDGQKRAILKKLQAADKIIAVSANAATLALPHLAEMKGAGAASLFAIGPATATALEAGGYSASIPQSEYNSEKLLALPAFGRIEDQAIVLLCGRGGRNYLELELSGRGAGVERIELYTRTPVVKDKIDPETLAEPDILTAMSADTVAALAALLIDSSLTRWQSIPLIVPGRRVADIASAKGFSKVLVAQKPTTESLLEVLGSIE